jgi:hypothetical protein
MEDRVVSGTTTIEWVALVLAGASLVVAVIAGGISFQALVRPRPVDPTLAETYGRPDRPTLITDGAAGRHFIKFLIENTGRKVLMYVRFSAEFTGSKGRRMRLRRT